MVKIRTRKDLNVGNVMRKIRNNAIKLENKSRVKLDKENVQKLFWAGNSKFNSRAPNGH